jgi:uncharacterized protein (DUF1697 family)
MHTLISMLRGINVGGQKTIRMTELKEIYESLGYSQVTTYVQSGNIVFDCANREVSSIAGAIEKEIARYFGFSVGVIVRHSDDFRRIINNNPFIAQRNEDPERLHVTFLAASPAAAVLNNLTAPAGTTDEYFLRSSEIYLFCPNGYGRTRLSNTFFEKKLQVLATTRNWKTVNALYNIAISRKNLHDN